jgi:glycosyltransferase involved in cell wall biosynthesis
MPHVVRGRNHISAERVTTRSKSQVPWLTLRVVVLLSFLSAEHAAETASSFRVTLLLEDHLQSPPPSPTPPTLPLQRHEELDRNTTSRHGSRFHLQIVPFPEPAILSKLAALLDIKWCGLSSSQGSNRCESLAQLWAPTLSTDSFHHRIERVADARAASSNVAASWILPYIEGAAEEGCWLEAEATVFDRTTAEPQTMARHPMRPNGPAIELRPSANAIGGCVRPVFRYPFEAERRDHERVWLATSFVAMQASGNGNAPGLGNFPFVIYSPIGTIVDEYPLRESRASLWFRPAVRRFAGAIATAGLNHDTMERVMESAVREEYESRLTRRRSTAVCLASHRRRLLESQPAAAPSSNTLHVVLGGGYDDNDDCSNPSSIWVTTDVNTLDVVDRRDWEELGLLPSLWPSNQFPGHSSFSLRMLGEHVLEHLTLPELHGALANIAAALSHHKGAEDSSDSGSTIRIAVPDAGVFETVGSEEADLRDWHHIRFTAWSLCETLRANGLNGRLLEWHYPIASHRIVKSSFSNPPFFIETNTSQGRVIGRIHDWDGQSDGRGRIKRSMRGGDVRGAVSLVVDASLFEDQGGSKESSIKNGGDRRNGDSCATLLEIVEATTVPGTWSYSMTPKQDDQPRQSGEGGSSAVKSGNLDRELTGMRQQAEDYMKHEVKSDTGHLHWFATIAVATTAASAGARIETLAATAQAATHYASQAGKVSNRSQALAESSEEAWCALSDFLLKDGQTMLALRALNWALRHGNGPLSKRTLSRLAAILDRYGDGWHHRRRLLQSPQDGQVFSTDAPVSIIFNLSSFDEEHPEALKNSDGTMKSTTLGRLALRTCISISYLGEVHADRNASLTSTDSPLAACVQTKNPVELSGMKSGWHAVSLQLWWLPSHTLASTSGQHGSIGTRFCIRGRFSIRSGRDACDVGENLVAATLSPQGIPVNSAPEQQQSGPSLQFVTIVLNGMPFLTHHAAVFSEAAARLNVSWHWHVVEGAALGRADASAPYSQRPLKGVRPHDGCSVDGTSEYLDEIRAPASQFSSHVTVHRNGDLLNRALTKGDWHKWRTGLLHERQHEGSSTWRSEGEGGKLTSSSRRVGVDDAAFSGVSCIWADKLQMINTAVHSISEPGALFQVDADELWTTESIVASYKLLFGNGTGAQSRLPSLQCIRVHCHFFISPNLVTISRNGYGHSNAYEWTRVWHFHPGDSFGSHAPPVLLHRSSNDQGGIWNLVGGEEHGLESRGEIVLQYSSAVPTTGNRFLATRGVRCLSPEAAARAGIGFTHYAYVLEEQVKFKEDFYGYEGATEAWRRLSNISEGSGQSDLPVRLYEYFPWLTEENLAAATRERFAATLADLPEKSPIARNVPIVPMPMLQQTVEASPAQSGTAEPSKAPLPSSEFVTVLDTVILQRQMFAPRGIARVWRSLLPLLPNSIIRALKGRRDKMSLNLVLLARQGTAEALMEDWKHATETPEATLRTTIAWAPPSDESRDFMADSLALGVICRRLRADVFISTEYTVPFPRAHVTKVLLLHDMTPERFNWKDSFWTVHKRRAVLEADAFVAVSQATADAFRQHYPSVSKAVAIAHNAISPAFLSGSLGTVRGEGGDDQITDFKTRVGLKHTSPYFLVVGMRLGYKNAAALFETLSASNLAAEDGTFDASILLIGGTRLDESTEEAKHLADLRRGVRENVVHVQWMADADLRTAYRGAAALVYLSIDEGFGMPIVEALSSGCPVLASDIPIFRELLSPVEDERGNPGLSAAFVDIQGKNESCQCTATIKNGNDECRAANDQPGVFLVDPSSKGQIWRAVSFFARTWLTPGNVETRAALADFAKKRYGSWAPLAAALARAAVVNSKQAELNSSALGLASPWAPPSAPPFF